MKSSEFTSAPHGAPFGAPQAWPTPDVVLVAAPEDLVHRVKPDFKIDSRTLKNPHHVAALYDKWGMHPDVLTYVRQQAALNDLLDNLPEQIEALWGSAKTHLPIVVLTTCLGAYHRSPAVNVILAERLVEAAFHVEQRIYEGKAHPAQPPSKRCALSLDDMLVYSRLHVVQGLPLSMHQLVGQLRPDVVALLNGGDDADE